MVYTDNKIKNHHGENRLISRGKSQYWEYVELFKILSILKLHLLFPKNLKIDKKLCQL